MGAAAFCTRRCLCKFFAKMFCSKQEHCFCFLVTLLCRICLASHYHAAARSTKNGLCRSSCGCLLRAALPLQFFLQKCSAQSRNICFCLRILFIEGLVRQIICPWHTLPFPEKAKQNIFGCNRRKRRRSALLRPVTAAVPLRAAAVPVCRLSRAAASRDAPPWR